MPPVDLENLVSACAGGCGDGKITCETLAGDDGATEDDVASDDDAAVPTADPDLPPESFWLSKDAEYDWFDRNTFYERRDSGRGSSNLNAAVDVNSNSNSQRFTPSRRSKAAIIGLPKTQKTTYVDPKRRTCKTATIRLFPKRPEPVGKSAVPVAEPGSPNVSCMGRVRSKRGRRRSNSLRRREKPAEKIRTGVEKQKKAGLYSKVIGMFRSKRGRKKSLRSGSRRAVEVADEGAAAAFELRQMSVSSREAPGLGGVMRFASGRRSSSWPAEDSDQAVSRSDRHLGVVSWS